MDDAADRLLTRLREFVATLGDDERALLSALIGPGIVEAYAATEVEGFGLDAHETVVCAAGALVRYLRDTHKADLAHVRAIAYRQASEALLIDPATLEHLEVVESKARVRAGSLLDEVDRTITPMGGRLLRS